MNFAEAALLIQGSTCVYSKKVRIPAILLLHILQLFYIVTLIDVSLGLLITKLQSVVFASDYAY